MIPELKYPNQMEQRLEQKVLKKISQVIEDEESSTKNEWDAPLIFENAMKKNEESKKSKTKSSKKQSNQKEPLEEIIEKPKEEETVKMKTHEELYRELKKKRKIK